MALGKKKRRRGVTLTELMLTISIASIVVVLGNTLFIQITRFFRLNTARIEIQRDARAIFNLMGRSIRQASGTSVTINSDAGQPPYSRIQFQKISGETVIYYQDGKRLFMVAGGTRTLTRNLRYIAFSHPQTDDDSIISVSLTLEAKTYEGGTKALQLSVEKFRIMN